MTNAEIIEILFKAVLIPAVLLLSKLAYNVVTTWVEEKTKNMKSEEARKYINMAVKAIMTSVDATFQTYVDSLKSQGKFDADAQKVAFEKAKTTALALLTDDMKAAITVMYGDFNLWIDNTIEQFVLANKTDDKQGTILSLMV